MRLGKLPAGVLPPAFRERAAVELASLGLRQRRADHDLLRRLESREHRCAVAQQIAGIDHRAGSRHDIAHHLLAIDRVRDTDGGGFDDVGALHQIGIDLDRRYFRAAADDLLLLTAGERQKAVVIQAAEISGAEAAPAMDFHFAVFAEIAKCVIAKAAEFDIAGFARGQAPPLGVDDGQIMISERPPDRAVTTLFAWNGRYPARLAGTATLRNRNAKFPLEP